MKYTIETAMTSITTKTDKLLEHLPRIKCGRNEKLRAAHHVLNFEFRVR